MKIPLDIIAFLLFNLIEGRKFFHFKLLQEEIGLGGEKTVTTKERTFFIKNIC